MTGTSTFRNLAFKRIVGWLLFIPIAYLIKGAFIFFARYQIENASEIRKKYEAVVKKAENEGVPVLFCANHLTFIDSVILLWVFNPAWKYVLNYKRQYWNVPAGDFFAKLKRFRYIMSLTKCIFVYRDASAAHKAEVLAQLRDILHTGDSLLIFPEGKRSRTGRFNPDTLASGAARLAMQEPQAKVVCVYVRGSFQDTYSNFPKKKSSFHVQLEELDLNPARELEPLSAKNAITEKIGKTLFGMEQNYFALHGGTVVDSSMAGETFANCDEVVTRVS